MSLGSKALLHSLLATLLLPVTAVAKPVCGAWSAYTSAGKKEKTIDGKKHKAARTDKSPGINPNLPIEKAAGGVNRLVQVEKAKRWFTSGKTAGLIGGHAHFLQAPKVAKRRMALMPCFLGPRIGVGWRGLQLNCFTALG